MAEMLVKIWNITGNDRNTALTYILPGNVSEDIAHERLFALMKVGVGQANQATQALDKCTYDLEFAEELLKNHAGNNCCQHYANDEDEAKAKAKERENVGANSCIPTGLKGMAEQLQRVLHLHRAEIYLLQLGQETSLLKYSTSQAGNLWFCTQGKSPEEKPWKELEVVVIRKGEDTFFLKHCQPN
jgi:hypothetical protein